MIFSPSLSRRAWVVSLAPVLLAALPPQAEDYPHPAPPFAQGIYSPRILERFDALRHLPRPRTDFGREALGLAQHELEPYSEAAYRSMLHNADLRVVSTSHNRGFVTNGNGAPLIGSANNPVVYPIVKAIVFAGTPREQGGAGLIGGIISIGPGTYSSMKFDAAYVGHDDKVPFVRTRPTQPLVLIGSVDERGLPTTHILADYSGDDAIAIRENPAEGEEFDWISFLRLKVSGSRSAFFLGGAGHAASGVVLQGITIADCEIDGGYDHKSGIDRYGLDPKWGIHSGPLSHARFLRNLVWRIKHEHGFYLHLGGSQGHPSGESVAGDGTNLLIGNAIVLTGRTPIQVVARKTEVDFTNLPRNGVPLTMVLNYMGENALAVEDNCQGGSGLSVFGGHDVVTVSLNLMRTGFNDIVPGLRQWIVQTCDDVPAPFTGLFRNATYSNDDYQISRAMLLFDNIMEMHPATGDREMVAVNSAQFAAVVGNDIRAGWHPTALRLGDGLTIHPAPNEYCVKDNFIGPGHILDASGAIVSQPFAIGSSACDDF